MGGEDTDPVIEVCHLAAADRYGLLCLVYRHIPGVCPLADVHICAYQPYFRLSGVACKPLDNLLIHAGVLGQVTTCHAGRYRRCHAVQQHQCYHTAE